MVIKARNESSGPTDSWFLREIKLNITLDRHRYEQASLDSKIILVRESEKEVKNNVLA